jgi:aspartyl/asparaginyl-tRNA synthetase
MGLGLGLERFVLFVTGIGNTRDVTPSRGRRRVRSLRIATL